MRHLLPKEKTGVCPKFLSPLSANYLYEKLSVDVGESIIYLWTCVLGWLVRPTKICIIKKWLS